MTPEIYFSVIMAARPHGNSWELVHSTATHVVINGEADLLDYLYDHLMETFPVGDGWMHQCYDVIKLQQSYSNGVVTYDVNIRLRENNDEQ